MNARTVAWGAFVLVGVAGCGHLETREALLRTPEAPTSKVELYMAEQALPTRPFYEVALVQAIGFGSEAHPEDVAHALADKAGRLGCDAVVRTFVDQGYSRANATGVCVKWLGPAPEATEPNAPLLPPAPRSNPAPPAVRPRPAPRIEPLPSAGPAQGGGR